MAFVLPFVVGCEPRSVATCVPGASALCACDDGRLGAQTCGASGAFDPCSCGGAGIDGSVADGGLACADLGCNQIDLLFVVDNSISMLGAQANLRAAIPGFLDTMRAELSDADLHVMVVDSDAEGYSLCESVCSNPDSVEPCESGDGTCVRDGEGHSCPGYRCGAAFERDACDTRLGGGVVFPVGDGASNRRCGFPEGRRYAESTDADFEAMFTCASQVGASGNGEERPLGAMMLALEGDAAGGCNAGFLRPSALLVVVLVSDAGLSSPDNFGGDAVGWRRRLLALKCGREEGVVFISVAHDGSRTRTEGDPCFEYFTGYGTTFRLIAEAFGTRGSSHEICDDFGDVLSTAVVNQITEACILF